VEHARDEANGRWLIRIRLIKGEDQLERAILERRVNCAHELVNKASIMLMHIVTWPKDDSIPEHDVIGAWHARDTAGWVGLQPLEVTDQTPPGDCGLQQCTLVMSSRAG
jgi:hypothetical protein